MKNLTKNPSLDSSDHHQVMTNLSLHLVVFLGICAQVLLADCPRLCECKWKNGKESVICLNANLSVVPLHLDAGTQVLDLTGNGIVMIGHDEFSNAGLVNLQKVYISKCRLKSLERYAFRHLINLVELDLGYNVLTSIPSHSFDSISELRELKLSGNPIQRITNDAFINVPQLVRLELSDCRINAIELRAFHGLERTLEWLKLDKNKIDGVQSESFTVLQSLHGLELANNPWNCSCKLRPLREWMLRKNVPYGIPPTCNAPKRLSSKSWDKLDLDEFACLPEIFAYDSKAQGIEGNNITMACNIRGIPEPSVRWLLKNKVIANLSGASYANGKKLYLVHLQNNSSDLTIFSADLQDAGVYTCSAENKAGKAEASVTLAVSRKPSESHFSSKVLLASVITGITFALASCLIAVCLCSARKKHLVNWRAHEREDNYEKIEMNHKVSGVNGGVQPAEIAIVGSRRHGDYRVIPGADTDQEVEEEEESGEMSSKKPWANSEVLEKRWNSPEHLLDPDDLHIPRRTLKEARDTTMKGGGSTCGTFSVTESNQASTSISSLSQHYPPSYPSRQMMPQMQGRVVSSFGNVATPSTLGSELLAALTRDDERKYPDLIENSSYRYPRNAGKACSEGGSVSDITELFCTLPRQRQGRYRSSDSQAPLLGDSRYGSSGGESGLSSQELNRRMSDSGCKIPVTNMNRSKVNKISGSYLNLTREDAMSNSPGHSSMSPTPLLDVTGLESRFSHKFSPTLATPNANSYDYHAAQLERFLEEYRTLQKELTRMKETCDNLRQDRATNNVRPVQDNAKAGQSGDVEGIESVVLTPSPNSNRSLEDSVDFRNFENQLTKYLMSKNLSQTFNSSGIYKK